MSALLKKLERKVGQTQQEQESSGMTAMMGDIRSGIESLRELAKQDSSRDERTSTLEKLVIRLYDALEKSEQNRIAEGEKEATAEEQKCARLEAELAALKLECEQVEQELDATKAARLEDARILGDVRASLARSEAVCEAEKRARIVAETALVQAKAEHERHMMIEKPDMEVGVAPPGWKLTPHKDAADNLLFMTLDPIQ